MNLDIIILAAGQGTRMKSSLPKVLHPLGGKPLLQHVLDTAQSLSPKNIYVVYGYEGETIQSAFSQYKIKWIHQEKQLGTAHAVMQVMPHLKNTENKVLILCGDVPLISSQILQALISKTSLDQLGLLTVHVENPQGFGRIIRNAQQKVIGIVEEKDANDDQKKITEINPSIYVTSLKNLHTWLPQISSQNSQKEFYLTDIIKENRDIKDFFVEDSYEVYGVNDLEQLYQLECYYQQKTAKNFRLSGVRVAQNVIFEGDVKIGAGSIIGAYSILRNVTIGENVEIKPYSFLEESVIGDHCKVGPYARLRPGTTLATKATIGNFVEIKNSSIGKGSKIPHLSYVGDTTIGKNVNFGAGAIICNYDGVSKHRTIIEDNVFIGSDSQLIAPVKIEEGAYIGTGSTITKNAPAHKLTLGRARQQTIDRWKRPQKEEK